MIFEKIAAIIADHTGSDIEQITESTTFEELGVDSLDTVEMVMKLEEELGVELEMDGKFDAVGDLVKFVETKLVHSERAAL
ncbi:MAG: phosphopantetheine-binding protein [Oscillospiraceae bacterium]|nr:phosphopantetheine-binding protein [Oscillospiraceae bacterium]